MMRKTVSVFLFLWLACFAGGCSSDVWPGEAENWVDGNYLIASSARKEIPEDERVKFCVTHDIDNFDGYQIVVDKANGDSEQYRASWNEKQRALTFEKGKLSFSKREYDVVAQFPVNWILDLDATAQYEEKTISVRRISYLYTLFLIAKNAMGFDTWDDELEHLEKE